MLESIAVAGKTAGERSDALFLSGASGAGKTHLLLGLCAEATALGHEVAFLPLRMFGARSVDALSGQGAAAMVCIDDVDAIAGMRDAEIALFDKDDPKAAPRGVARHADAIEAAADHR